MPLDPPPGYAYPDIWPQAAPFQPFAPNLGQFSQSSPVMASLAQMAMQSMMGNNGWSMMGVNDQNLMDRFQQNWQTRMHFGLMQDMAQYDRPALVNAVGTGFAMMNRPFNDDARSTADFASRMWPQMAPIMATMAPEMMDSMFGMRGSAAVFGAGVSMASRGRFDPISGAFGMGRGTASALGGSVWEEMFAGNRYLSSPLSAGQTGQLWQQLQVMGMMPGTSTIDDLNRAPGGSRAIDRAMMNSGLDGRSWDTLTAEERGKITSDIGVQDEIKAFDAKKISGTLREWGRSIEAMKEIFGDAGQPNAPIPVLMQALRQLTAGGMTQMNPNELSQMVRTFSNLAQASGFGMQGATMLTQVGEAQAAQLGLSGVFAPQAAMEAMAFGASFAANGAGGVQGWGMPDIATITQAKEKLNMSGRASILGNQIGLLYRTVSEFGGFGAGSLAAQYQQAIEAGQSTFAGGRDIRMSDAAFAEMLAGSTGSTTDEVLGRLQQRFTNSSGLYYNPQAIRALQAAQRAEAAGGWAASTMAQGIGTALRGNFSDREALVARLGRSMAAISYDPNRFKMDWLGHGNEQARQTGLAKEMYSDLVRAAHDANDPQHQVAKEFLSGKSEDEAQAELAHIAASGWGSFDSESFKQRNSSAATEILARSSSLEGGAGRIEASSRAQALAEDMLGRAGKGGIVRRFMEGIISGDVKTLGDLGKLGLGGVSESSLRQIIAGGNFSDRDVKGFHDSWQRIQALRAEMMAKGSNPQEIEARIRQETSGMDAGILRMMQYAETAGIDIGPTMFEEGSLGSVNQRILDLRAKSEWGKLGNISGKVSDFKKELGMYKNSDAFKKLSKGGERVAEIEGLLDQAASATNEVDATNKLTEASKKIGALMEDEKKAKEQEEKEIKVTSTSVYLNGVEVQGGATVVIGGNNTTEGGA